MSIVLYCAVLLVDHYTLPPAGEPSSLGVGLGGGAARAQRAYDKEKFGCFCYCWQYSYLFRQKHLMLGVGVVFVCSYNMLCTFSSNLNISNLVFRVSIPLRGPSRSFMVTRRPICSLLQPRISSSLKLSTSTCIKEMWRVVADLQDRHTDLCRLGMHKFVGWSISPTKKGSQVYHHKLYSEFISKFYRKL